MTAPIYALLAFDDGCQFQRHTLSPFLTKLWKTSGEPEKDLVAVIRSAPREAPAKLKTRLLQVRRFHEELRLAGVKSATEGLYVLQIAGDLRREEGQDDKDEEFG